MNDTIQHVKREFEIARMLFKYGRADLIQPLGLDEAALADDFVVGKAAPEQLAADLERMGPTFIKVGQLLSTRSDLLAEPYLQSLARLQESVEPIGADEVRAIIEEELQVRLSKAFSEFDDRPLGAASLAQVHAARLNDGREVAVKVQRPGVREAVMDDLVILARMVKLASEHSEIGRRYDLDEMFGEFRRTMLRELDFRREARNLATISSYVSEYPLLVVPLPIDQYSTSRVLTMERLIGTSLGSLSPFAKLEIDGDSLGQQLLKAYMDLILVHGCFSADPHPGNLLVTSDGRLGLIDMGMVAYLPPRTQDDVLRLLLAVSEGDSDRASEICIRMGKRLPEFNEDQLRREVILLPNQDIRMSDFNTGRLVLELVRVAAQSGLKPSPDLAMLGKTLLNLDGSVRLLSDEIDPSRLIQQHAAQVMRRHLLKTITPGKMFNTALELNELVQELPGRLNVIMDRAAGRQFELKIHAFDEEQLISSMQKIANRITLGLVVAALIVGAALLSQVPTSFEILGYPGVAILCFTVAATVGAVLVGSILFTDLHVATRRKKRA